MSEETKDILLINPLDDRINGLVETIMEEEDPNKTKDLVDLFNWNMSKKNVARLQKLNNLYDSITDKMVERVEKKSDQFSNGDLIDYVKTIQGAIDINTKNLSQVQEPPLIVQQTNTNINVNVVDTFDREAKERILAAVKATLAQAATKTIEVTATDVVEPQTIEDISEDKGE